MLNEKTPSLSEYGVLVTLLSNNYLQTTISFTFGNDVKDVADFGTIFKEFDEYCWDDDRREDDLVVDAVELWPRDDFLDKEGVDTLCDSIMIKNKQLQMLIVKIYRRKC